MQGFPAPITLILSTTRVYEQEDSSSYGSLSPVCLRLWWG